MTYLVRTLAPLALGKHLRRGTRLGGRSVLSITCCAAVAISCCATVFGGEPSDGPALLLPPNMQPSALLTSTTDEERSPRLVVPTSENSASAEPTTEMIQERHPNGKVRLERHVAQDANDNFVNHGPWVMFNDRGQETARGDYRFGKRHGTWARTHAKLRELDVGLPASTTQFAPPLLSVATFNDGELDGEWSIVDAQERRVVTFNYLAGKRQGKSTWYHANGTPAREVEYKAGFRDGACGEWTAERQVVKQVSYVHGARLAPHVEWYSKGVKKSEAQMLFTPEFAGTVDDWWNGSTRELPIEQSRAGQSAVKLEAIVGLRHGPWRVWHQNGQLAASGEFDNELPVGEFGWWHPNGQKACEGRFERGQPVGKWSWWHHNGQKQSCGLLVAGVQSGKWLWWDAEGRVSKSADFHQDGSGPLVALRPEGVQPPNIDFEAVVGSPRKASAAAATVPTSATVAPRTARTPQPMNRAAR